MSELSPGTQRSRFACRSDRPAPAPQHQEWKKTGGRRRTSRIKAKRRQGASTGRKTKTRGEEAAEEAEAGEGTSIQGERNTDRERMSKDER
eukprot:763743-Hanusia_phi.AAC.2